MASTLMKNKGSLARDSLAQERSFLSGFKAFLVSIGLGMAIVSVLHSPIAGALVVMIGMSYMAMATIYYLNHLIEMRNEYVQLSKLPLLVLVVLTFVSIIALVFVALIL